MRLANVSKLKVSPSWTKPSRTLVMNADLADWKKGKKIVRAVPVYSGTTKPRKVSKVDDRQRRNAGSAAVGAGGTSAGLGLLASGFPGAKVKPGAGPVKGAAVGGIFGYRIGEHQKGTRGFERNVADWTAKGKYRTGQEQFKLAREAGKIAPEKEVIGHMKRYRKFGRGALYGGAALAGAGALAMRGTKPQPAARRRPVRKADRRTDVAGSALLGTGLTTAAAGQGLKTGLDRQARAWRAKEVSSLAEGARNLPGTAHRKRAVSDYPAPEGVNDPYRHRLSPNELRQGRGRRPPTRYDVRRAGSAHGAAAQQGYFARTYRSNAKMFGRLRGAGLGVAGVGGGLLLADQHRQGAPKPTKRVRKRLGSLQRVKLPRLSGQQGSTATSTSQESYDRRKKRRGAITKASEVVRSEMYPNLRPIPDNGYIRLVRNPTDVTRQIAATRLMDRARAEERRPRKRGRLSPSTRYTMGRQYMFSTMGSDRR